MASVAGSDSPFTLTECSISRAIRLVPSRYDHPPVLSTVATSLDAAYELDALTNPRHAGAPGCASQPGFLLPENELLHSHIVNGSFIHGSTHSRFGIPTCGTWYSALTMRTAHAEVGFHKRLEYSDLDPVGLAAMGLDGPWETKYSQWEATYTASLHVIDTQHPSAGALLDPADYRLSQQAARELRAAGALGVTYPSVRDPKGHCQAIFHPSVIQAVRLAGHWSLTVDPAAGTAQWAAA